MLTLPGLFSIKTALGHLASSSCYYGKGRLRVLQLQRIDDQVIEDMPRSQSPFTLLLNQCKGQLYHSCYKDHLELAQYTRLFAIIFESMSRITSFKIEVR